MILVPRIYLSLTLSLAGSGLMFEVGMDWNPYNGTHALATSQLCLLKVSGKFFCLLLSSSSKVLPKVYFDYFFRVFC